MADTPHVADADVPLHRLIVDRLVQPQFILAVLSTIFLWWLTYRLLGDTVPDRMREVVSVLVGFITGQMVGPGWQFYFGTTKASDDKTKALSDNAATLRKQGVLPGGEMQARDVSLTAETVDVTTSQDIPNEEPR